MKKDKTAYRLYFILAMVCLFTSILCVCHEDYMNALSLFLLNVFYLMLCIKRRDEYQAKKKQELIDNLIEETK